jgi:pyruvate formate lyase activating enzyme
MITTSLPYISGIVFSGGEPTLQKDVLIELARRAKGMGLVVGIQTNGLFPETLDALISEKLVDRIALDYKTQWEGFSDVPVRFGNVQKENYQKNIKKSITICSNAFRENHLTEFEVVVTVFYENAEYIRKISEDIGSVPLVLQQGIHKPGLANRIPSEITQGEYICKKRNLQEKHQPLTLSEMKTIADGLGRVVRIRTREIGEIVYMKVIGVVGMPASGKGEFSRIAAGMGIPVIVMGDMIRRAVENAGLEPNDSNFGTIANRLRQEHGMDAIAQLCIPEIQKQSAPIILVDGIRGDAEVMLFRHHFSGFTLISIESSFEKRLARIAARARSDDFVTADELRARDARELSWGLDKALGSADINLENESSLEEFGRAVRQLITKLERDP